jgi:hypothetical protein
MLAPRFGTDTAIYQSRASACATNGGTTMTNEQRDVMRHALGLGRASREYRNHFVTGPGTTDYPHCEALVAAGLMRRREGNPLSGGDPIYSVTDAGRAALRCAEDAQRRAVRRAVRPVRTSAGLCLGSKNGGMTWTP